MDFEFHSHQYEGRDIRDLLLQVLFNQHKEALRMAALEDAQLAEDTTIAQVIALVQGLQSGPTQAQLDAVTAERDAANAEIAAGTAKANDQAATLAAVLPPPA